MARPRLGSILNLTLALIGVAVLGALGFVSGRHLPWATSTLEDEVKPGESAVVLTRIGLDARALAAAGVTAQQTTVLVNAAEAYMSTHLESIRQADQNWADARAEVDRLTQLIQGGGATEQEVGALGAAKAALTQATAARQSLLDAAYAAGTAELGGNAVSTINAIRTNTWDLATQYRVANRGEVEWVQLRDALASLRVAGDYGEEPDQHSVQIVTTADSDPAVAAAKTNLDVNLPAVTAAWTQALGG